MSAQEWLSVVANFASVVTAVVAVIAYVQIVHRRGKSLARLETYLLMHDGQHTVLRLAAALGMSENEIIALAARSKVIVRGVAGGTFVGGPPPTLTLGFDPEERDRLTHQP